jgi:hypothetical protein
MAPIRSWDTHVFEQWGKLEIFQTVLERSISLHQNGSTAVTMSEMSLYNLTTAGVQDFLEITVSKIESLSPIAIDHTRRIRNIPPRANLAIQNGDNVDHEPTNKVSPPPACIICGNCERVGHAVRDCVGPVDEFGEIDGCPKCNTARSHVYDNCPVRDSTEDFDLIYRYRQRKPPVKSHMSWTSFLSGRHQPSTWPRYIPWSARFALDQQEMAYRSHRKPEWFYYAYDRIGRPEEEAQDRQIDPESEYLLL